MLRFLAFDYGATSGRSIVGGFDGSRLCLTEQHRFLNQPVRAFGGLSWDILRLIHDLKAGLSLAAQDGSEFASVGIDTWGVDVGFLDGNGALLSNPLHYRDSLTDGILEKAFAIVPKEELYAQTGTQFMQFNTLFQLLALSLRGDLALQNARHMLFIPDLLNYVLTGEMASEFTVASTSQLLNMHTKDWNYDLAARFSLPSSIFPGLRKSASVLGTLLPSICEETGAKALPVVLTGSHDTAAAVASLPTTDRETLYISSGTWSLLGVESDSPIITEASYQANLTNEGGLTGNIRVLKNVMGLWICNECYRQWEKEGAIINFPELDAATAAAEGLTAFINPDDPLFFKPGNMPRRVQEYCAATGQPVPQSKGAILRVINESLALRYRSVVAELEALSGVRYPKIHIVGGGSKNPMLCAYTANALQREVVAGPVEATACGNILSQMLALSEISSLAEGRELIASSFELKTYAPKSPAEWDAAYEKYTQILAKNTNLEAK